MEGDPHDRWALLTLGLHRPRWDGLRDATRGRGCGKSEQQDHDEKKGGAETHE